MPFYFGKGIRALTQAECQHLLMYAPLFDIDVVRVEAEEGNLLSISAHTVYDTVSRTLPEKEGYLFLLNLVCTTAKNWVPFQIRESCLDGLFKMSPERIKRIAELYQYRKIQPDTHIKLSRAKPASDPCPHE